MVITLLVCLAATVATGIMAYGEEGKGPLAPMMSDEVNPSSTGAGHSGAAKTRGEPEESAIGDLHGLLANIAVALVVVHLFGVAVASLVHRENLVLGSQAARS